MHGKRGSWKSRRLRPVNVIMGPCLPSSSFLRTVLLCLLQSLVLSNSLHASVSSKNLQWLIRQTLTQPYLCLLLKPWARYTKVMKDGLQGAYTQGQERPVDRRTDAEVWWGTHEGGKVIREQKGPSSPASAVSSLRTGHILCTPLHPNFWTGCLPHTINIC